MGEHTRDIRRDVLLWPVHHCHRVDEREVILEDWGVGSKRDWRWRVWGEEAWYYIPLGHSGFVVVGT